MSWAKIQLLHRKYLNSRDQNIIPSNTEEIWWGFVFKVAEVLKIFDDEAPNKHTHTHSVLELRPTSPSCSGHILTGSWPPRGVTTVDCRASYRTWPHFLSLATISLILKVIGSCKCLLLRYSTKTEIVLLEKMDGKIMLGFVLLSLIHNI